MIEAFSSCILPEELNNFRTPYIGPKIYDLIDVVREKKML